MRISSQDSHPSWRSWYAWERERTGGGKRKDEKKKNADSVVFACYCIWHRVLCLCMLFFWDGVDFFGVFRLMGGCPGTAIRRLPRGNWCPAPSGTRSIFGFVVFCVFTVDFFIHLQSKTI